MTLATMTCIGFLVFFSCEEAKKPQPDPQRVVCSGPSVPIFTDEEAARTPPRVRRFVGKVKQNRKDNKCKT